MLNARAQLAKDVGRYVLGALRDEEDADALGADQAHGLGDLREEVLGGVGEEQVRLVEEEDELWLVEVADLGEVREEVREQPHQEGAEQRGTVLQRGQFEGGDGAAAVGANSEQVLGVEGRLAEELLGALRLELRDLAQDHARGRGGDAADARRARPCPPLR